MAFSMTALVMATASVAPVVAQNAARAPQHNADARSETGLLQIAQQRGLNVLIDSTVVNPAAPALDLGPKLRGPVDKADNVIAFYAQEHRLSTEKRGPNTFLFWAEPDQNKLAQAVLRGEGFGAERGVPSPGEMLMALRTHLDPQGVKQEQETIQQATNRPVDPRQSLIQRQNLRNVPPPVLEWKMSQLPADLQRQLAALVFQHSLNFNPQSRDYSELWTRDEVWERAYVWYRRADPRYQREQTLAVQAIVENDKHRLLLSLYPFEGSTGVEVLREDGASAPITPELEAGKLRVLPVGETPAVTLDETLHPAGAALASLRRASATQLDLTAETGLQKQVSLQATRRPLTEFLRSASQATGVQLAVNPQLEAQLISVHVQQMPLAELMQGVAHLYGAHWLKDEAQAFTLTSSGLSPLELELRRLGHFDWYRARDIVLPTHLQRKADFNQLAARLYDEAGDAIAQAPGYPLSNLPLDTRQELRRMATEAMMRRVLYRQVRVRDTLRSEWSFRLTGSIPRIAQPTSTSWDQPTLDLLIAGQQTRKMMMWNPLQQKISNGPKPS